MKAPFQKVVIPDAFDGGIGDTEVHVCGPDNDVTTDHVEMRSNNERIAYTPDEARAIGRALIAAADHIQHDGAGILASEALELWELAQKLQEAYHEGDLEDAKKQVSAVAAFVVDFKLEAFRKRPRTVNYDLPEDNS